MAARYWVGGTGTWDASTTTNWAASSGGAGGVSVPGAADDVFFDGSSGAGTVTISINPTIQSLTCTGYTGTISITGTMTIGSASSGSFTLAAGMTLSGALTLNVTTVGATVGTITTAGKTLAALNINGNGTWRLLDTITVSGQVALGSGTFDTNGQTCTWGSFSSSNSNTRTLTLGASAITISGGGSTAWDAGTATNLTVSANTATVTFTNGSSSPGFNTATFNWNGLSLIWTSGGTSMGIFGSGPGTFKNLTVTGTSSKTDAFTLSQSHTFTGTVTFSGNSQSARLLVNTLSGAGTGGNAAVNTLTIAAHGAHANVDFQDITIAGAGGALSGTLIGDCGGNSGITFTVSTTQTWQGTVSGNWSNAAKWTSRVPLPQDDVRISSAFSAGQTITLDMPRLCRALDCTGTTGNPTLSNGATVVSVYGSITLVPTMAWTSTSTVKLQSRGNATLTSANAGFGFTWQLIAPGGSYTQLDDCLNSGALTILSGTWITNGHNLQWASGLGSITLQGSTLFAATLDASGGGNVTVNGFTTTGTGTKTLKLGTGTWTLNSTGTVWNIGGTNLTVVAGTATINITDTSGSGKTFAGGSFTWPTLRYSAAGSGSLTITGNNTFASLDLECSTARTVTLQANGSQMILGTLTIKGAAGQLLSFVSGTPTQQTGLWVVPGGTLAQSFTSLSADVILTSGQNVHAINVITDASRLAALSWGTGQQGGTTDGAPAGSGYRIVRLATNLFRRGQCDAVTGDVAASNAGSTRSVDATVPARFSPQSFKVVCDGTAPGQGFFLLTAIGQAAAAGTMGVGAVDVMGVAGQSYTVNLRWIYTDLSSSDGATTTFTATGAWQRITPAGLAVSVGKTGDQFAALVQINGTRAETFRVAHPMFETGQAVVAPYVATSGGAVATWGASRARFYAGLLNLTKAWSFVTRVRVGWSDADSVGFTFNPRFATLENDATHRFTCVYNRGTRTLTFLATNGGANVGPGTLAASLPALNAGDAVTVAGIVDPVAKTLGVSINGAAIVTSAVGVDFPTITDPSIDIGTEVGNNPIMGRELWFVLAQRAFSNAEVAAYAALGDSDPDFSANAPVEFWNALTAAYEVPPASVVAPVIA